MKAFSYQFFEESEETLPKEIALFKRVEVGPSESSFLSSKLVLQNYCLMSIESGQFDWNFNDKTYRITPEDLILACPGVVMEKNFKPVEKGGFYKIALNPDYYFVSPSEEKFEESEFTERKEISFILSKFRASGLFILQNSEEVKLNFKKLEEEFRSRELGYRVRIRALINELIVSTYRRYCMIDKKVVSGLKDPGLDKLTEELMASLSHHWSVKEMASFTNMGVTQLSQRMKSQLGYSPFDYLIYLRINRAVQLLKETDEPITGIALDTGFYSSQHFSNTFKKVMGECPSNFRKTPQNSTSARS
ncbi:AraC family transcriptional regulator [Jiulongibacter sediminis]|jgi:AraC-like DNA-binding protein|uniref:helix-turn-helix domain-containing protein n=1 Tax=Jiulongibacter sediminis TaxID=1605367 RepID=UPI0026F0B255|nr:helix-turn-helix domain-containing protein [Jiulongibacter sediminis]